MSTPALARYARERVDAGLAHLVSAQHADGLWRDYALTPGASEGWSTAWIGWHVSRFASRPTCTAAARRAAVALGRIRGPGGWGYNRSTGVDADSTAWALRFICRVGFRCGRVEGERLAEYVDREGRVHTFDGAQHGTWSGAHDDVTPIVGLALLACDSRSEALARVRAAVVAAQRPDGTWASFWWASDVYATFWSVYFLRRSGGVPAGVGARIRARLGTPMPSCALEAALWLVLAIELEQPERPPQDRLVEHLLEASTCHGWGGSPLLLVPTRFDGDTASHPGPHADEHGLMTTAAASWALARWSAREA